MTFEWKLKCICQNFLFDDSNIFGKMQPLACNGAAGVGGEGLDWNAACCNDNHVQFRQGRKGRRSGSHTKHLIHCP